MVEMIDLGKRIAVVGVSASGKSIFGRKLAAKTSLPLTHVDAIMWKPGWDYIGDEATVEELKKISSGEEWVIEGYIEKDAFDAVFNRAESILYLDYPPYIASWRYIKRWWKHRKNPRPEIEGCPEKFSFEFLGRVWQKREVYHLNKFLGKIPNPGKITKLKSPFEADALIQTL